MTSTTALLTSVKGENRVLLQSVSWQTFNQLLEELGNKRGQRLAYDQGVLEVMSPLGIHENNNRFLSLCQVPKLIERSAAIGETTALREFRQWLRAVPLP